MKVNSPFRSMRKQRESIRFSCECDIQLQKLIIAHEEGGQSEMAEKLFCMELVRLLRVSGAMLPDTDAASQGLARFGYDLFGRRADAMIAECINLVADEMIATST